MDNKKHPIDQLKDLSPQTFENLAYDLVVASGLRNAIWRTPGPDGGRDIEGEVAATDFSGFQVIVRWYVECKRYAGTLDWPAVREKISYAENHAADFLLIITTAHLSPQCKSEVSRWNANHRRPIVRSWDESNIEQILRRYPAVMVKYGLTDDARAIPPSFLSLASQTSKVVQAAYGAAENAGYSSPSLEAASALAELVTVRLGDIERGQGIVIYPFDAKEDHYEWLQISGDPSHLSRFDRYGLRAFLALAIHVWKLSKLDLATTGPGSLRLSLVQNQG